MLILDKTQFLKELESLKNSKDKSNDTSSNSIHNTTSIDDTDSPSLKTPENLDSVILENKTYDSFRKPKGPNIPKEVKSIIGALGTQENYQEVSEAFGISKDTVGNLVNNNHSNPDVIDKKESVLDRIKEVTLQKIDKCIDFLDISRTMPNKELLSTAESLSRVHRNITPANEPPANIAQFVFYVPERQNKLEDYEEVVATQ